MKNQVILLYVFKKKNYVNNIAKAINVITLQMKFTLFTAK